jgi:hypothetical protein
MSLIGTPAGPLGGRTHLYRDAAVREAGGRPLHLEVLPALAAEAVPIRRTDPSGGREHELEFDERLLQSR